LPLRTICTPGTTGNSWQRATRLQKPEQKKKRLSPRTSELNTALLLNQKRANRECSSKSLNSRLFHILRIQNPESSNCPLSALFLLLYLSANTGRDRSSVFE